MFTGLFFLAIGVAVLAVWVFTLLDIIKSARMSPSKKLLWILIVVFFPFLGTLLYIAIGRRR